MVKEQEQDGGRRPANQGVPDVVPEPNKITFWRFVNALHRNAARQIPTVMRILRERVWEAANVKSEVVTIDTKSYQPMLTRLA